MRQTDDITNDLKNSAIKKFSKNVEALLQFFKQCTNPFSQELSHQFLYNISTRNSVNNQIYYFLSNVERTGDQQRATLIS